MSLNAPPDIWAVPLIAAAMQEIARSDVAELLNYLPHTGLPAHRAAMAEWHTRDLRLALAPDRLVLCNGAQHDIALTLLAASRTTD